MVIYLGISTRNGNEAWSIYNGQSYSLHSDPPTSFEDLNQNEVLLVKKYMAKVLNLTDIEKAKVSDSYLYNIELEAPWSKRDIKGLNRFAIGTVFHGSLRNPVVKEYTGTIINAQTGFTETHANTNRVLQKTATEFSGVQSHEDIDRSKS